MENLDAKISDIMSPVANALKREGLANCIYPYWADKNNKIACCDLYMGFLDHVAIEKYLKVCKETGANLWIKVNPERGMLAVSLTRSLR